MLLIESMPKSFPSSPLSSRSRQRAEPGPAREPALKSWIASPYDKLGGRRGGSVAVLVGRREMLVDHVAVGLEPVAVLDELATLDRPHLHPTATLVVGLGNLHRRNHAAQREAIDRLHALLHVL